MKSYVARVAAAAAVVLAGGAAQADVFQPVTVGVTGVDLPGPLTAFTVTMGTVGTHNIGGFDITFEAAGGLNQVTMPGVGVSTTPFADSNLLLDNVALAGFRVGGSGSGEDTQFLFPKPTLTVTGTESATQLRGVFTLNTAVASLPLARIVVPDGGSVSYSGQVSFAGSGGQVTDVSGSLVIPEPASVALGLAGILVAVRWRKESR